MVHSDRSKHVYLNPKVGLEIEQCFRKEKIVYYQNYFKLLKHYCDFENTVEIY